MKCLMRHLDMIKGRDGLGGFSMSENALPIFNQLIKLKICCCIKLMSRLFRMSSMQIYYNATTLIEARHINLTIAWSGLYFANFNCQIVEIISTSWNIKFAKIKVTLE